MKKNIIYTLLDNNIKQVQYVGDAIYNNKEYMFNVDKSLYKIQLEPDNICIYINESDNNKEIYFKKDNAYISITLNNKTLKLDIRVLELRITLNSFCAKYVVIGDESSIKTIRFEG